MTAHNVDRFGARPTPEQIARAWEPPGHRRQMLTDLAEHGYVIVPRDDYPIEAMCELMHDAYEDAAVEAGWQTQYASRKPWSDVPEANRATMRVTVAALLDHIFGETA